MPLPMITDETIEKVMTFKTDLSYEELEAEFFIEQPALFECIKALVYGYPEVATYIIGIAMLVYNSLKEQTEQNNFVDFQKAYNDDAS